MELNDSLVSILDKIRIDAEDIVGIIDFGIKPMMKETEQEEYELSVEKLGKLINELILVKENLNKDFSSLRRKIWGIKYGN